MEGRRLRRFGRGRQQNIQTLLPLRLTRLSNTVSCWYCDFKSTVLNEPLFRFGRKYSRCLRVWFSSGIGFSLSALLGVTLILIWELGRALHLFDGSEQLSCLLSGSIFGFSSSISGLSISLPDIGYVCISSILSVFAHEVGHALAAASEGVQMEYIAVFLAGLFPGALVAFDHEELQELPRFATLRVYCAGIWHNAAFCVVCCLGLFLLPLILDPFYIHGESPMVLDVSPMSPLSGYLSPRDLIISLDGIHIHSVQQWKEIIALSNEGILQHQDNAKDFEGIMGINERKGYCVPYYLIEESLPASAQVEGNKTTCANDLFAFAAIPCLDSHVLGNISNEFNNLQGRGRIHCFNPKDVIKLKRCGDIGMIALSNSTSCPCLEKYNCILFGTLKINVAYIMMVDPG